MQRVLNYLVRCGIATPDGLPTRIVWQIALIYLLVSTLIFTLVPFGQAQSTGRLVTVLSSAARTQTTASQDYTNLQENLNVRGAYFLVNVSGVSGTVTATLAVQAKDMVSGNYRSIFTATSGLDATGSATYLIYPGAGNAADDVTQTRSYPLPPAWRVRMIHSTANPITYTVSAQLLN
ncbi:MAG: hypothetical protein KJ077_10640 [Anaerolineae bacterium]|nr:hypothetical protein [Anaerolineae bacterium]